MWVDIKKLVKKGDFKDFCGLVYLGRLIDFILVVIFY